MAAYGDRLWFWVQINKVAYQSSLRPCKNGSFVHWLWHFLLVMVSIWYVIIKLCV